jgi:hypothetical protein
MAWDHGDVSASSNTCGAYRDGQFTGIAPQSDDIVLGRQLAQPLDLAAAHHQVVAFCSAKGGTPAPSQLQHRSPEGHRNHH